MENKLFIGKGTGWLETKLHTTIESLEFEITPDDVRTGKVLFIIICCG